MHFGTSYTFVIILSLLSISKCNRPPRFVMDGQTEIVLRLKEGDETPIGTLLYTLKGFDADGDKLRFGIRASTDSDIIIVETISDTEANIYLNKLLDREEKDEYALVLSLTDGHLGKGNFVTQSLLILVEDVNDNIPVFKNHPNSILLREDAPLGAIAHLEATDADEGPFGQVVYNAAPDVEKHLFSISTVGEKAVIRLIGSLDYEKQTVHQVKVLAVDRAKEGRVNTGTAIVLVRVLDVEDRPPEFIRVTPIARITENSPVGTTVLQVIAVDGDRGINNKIQYSLETSNDNQTLDPFKIEVVTGKVVTASIIDREALPFGSSSYILQIKATEIGSHQVPVPFTTTEVTVMISDINDETPTFKSKLYECEVAENAPNNTPLTFIGNAVPEVFDYDQGINGTFQLYVKSKSEVFEISPKKATNEATFSIKVKNNTQLDYEKIKVINLTIVAKEIVKNSPKFSEVPVVVHILDRNDNYPEFTKKSYEVWVPENCEVATTVAWIQALDEDSGNYGTQGVRYTNIAGSIANLLNIDPVSGILTVKTAGGPSWDREQAPRHYLSIEARDDMGNGNRNSVQLTINLEDINDNSPIFIQNKYEARLMENQLSFEKFLRVEARDADLNGTQNSEVEYSLVGELHENFTLDRTTGEIYPKYPIDFESIEGPEEENVRILYLTLRARDKGSPSLYSEVPLLVFVEDINDFPPVFEYLFYNTSVFEDTRGETNIMQVKAFDFDGSSPNNHVVYRIQQGAFDKFVIDSETGVISIAHGANLDPDLTHPRKNVYNLKVLALDGGQGENQLQAAVTVEVTILDVNNKNPKFLETPEISILENTLIGTTITTLRAVDPDENANLTYILNKLGCQAINENGIVIKQAADCLKYFSLDFFTGHLRIVKLIDREEIEQFILSVTVRDLNSETGIQEDITKIKIKIEDVNDNSPRFKRSHYKFAVMENSKNDVFIGTIKADDPDKNKSVIYQLIDNQYYINLIHLDEISGDISVANKIDREVYEWINITVKALDSGIPPRFAKVDVVLQILDENDNSPIFAHEPTAVIIPEDISPGSKIALIKATDDDSGEFGKITFILDQISSQGKFSIEGGTGILRVEEKLDREKKENYLLIVEAWDNYQYGFKNGESRNTFKQINVTLQDINDNAPELTIEPMCINITEFHETGQPITTIRSSDKDDPNTSNGQVIIDIADGNEDELFELQQINDWVVQIRSRKSLKGKHGNYTLIMRGQDLGTPSFLVEEPVHICVMDYNDHAPVFVSPSPNSTLRVPENATVGSALVQIVALDEDIGPNGVIKFRLKSDPAGHWKTFNLQSDSGILELAQPLDRKTQKFYDIRIEAYDLGLPTSLSSDLDLTVYISDIRGYQPQFADDEFTIEFTEFGEKLLLEYKKDFELHIGLPCFMYHSRPDWRRQVTGPPSSQENQRPGAEAKRLPDTIDRDELDYEGTPSPICYFIVGGNENNHFSLHPIDHTLHVIQPLDREEQNIYLLLIKATEDCSYQPEALQDFDSSNTSQLKVIIKVLDINDNAPKFIRRVFTGGVSTATPYGTKFMSVKAQDADEGRNAAISYYIVGKIQMTLTEGLDLPMHEPFTIERDTGAVRLNFDPQQGMKGYFDCIVLANDTGGLQDTARVFIYLLREDQRVRFVLRQHAPDLRNRIEVFRGILGNVTGHIVNIDEFRVHANKDGSIDKTKTDLYLHLVNKKDNSILEVPDVLKLVDQNTENLNELFKQFNVLDTQPGKNLMLRSKDQILPTSIAWLTAVSMFLLLMVLLILALFVTQRQAYQRKLKAATATAYVRAESEIEGKSLSTLCARVPNTNKHSMEGSNPIWLKAYENEWYREPGDLSISSDPDSLDENVICSGESFGSAEFVPKNNEKLSNETLTTSLLDRQNLYQTLASMPVLPVPHPRKLETTEL